MSLPTISYEHLHKITSDEVKHSDEKKITEIVNTVYDRVVETAKLGYCVLMWKSNFDYYDYKHIVLAANRLRVIFPGALIEQKKGHTIIVDWY